METIGKGKVLAAVVRTFFKYFTLGIIEGKHPGNTDMGVYEPKNVKMEMIDHFENISKVFNQEAFYAISRINYVEEELETELQAFVAAGNGTSAMELMRFACRTAEFYDTMIAEYKRNIEALLCGMFASLRDEAATVAHPTDLGTIDTNTAESIINRIANQAYTEGKKLVSK